MAEGFESLAKLAHQVSGKEAQYGPCTAVLLGEVGVAPVLTRAKLPFLPADA